MESIDISIVGAGPVGLALALVLSNKGYKIEVFEKRTIDEYLRIGNRSINLAISERGQQLLSKIGLSDQVLQNGVPMYGRTIHHQDTKTSFTPYGGPTNKLYSSGRSNLVKFIYDEAIQRPNIKVYFGVKVSQINFNKGTFTTTDLLTNKEVHRHSTVTFGADGAYSIVRKHMINMPHFSYEQKYETYGYKEFSFIPKDETPQYLESLHIWPRGEFMLIALPNKQDAYTGTLFMPLKGKNSFEDIQDQAGFEKFFTREFPDLKDHIPDFWLQSQANPLGSLHTVKCAPWHIGTFCLVGDAAHAITPFYGQGLNAGFQDVYALDELIQPGLSSLDEWKMIFDQYQEQRKPNADCIMELAHMNFVDMRRANDPQLLLNKKIISHLVNQYGYLSQYYYVSFTTQQYQKIYNYGKVEEQILHEIQKIPNYLEVLANPTPQQQILDILSKYSPYFLTQPDEKRQQLRIGENRQAKQQNFGNIKTIINICQLLNSQILNDTEELLQSLESNNLGTKDLSNLLTQLLSSFDLLTQTYKQLQKSGEYSDEAQAVFQQYMFGSENHSENGIFNGENQDFLAKLGRLFSLAQHFENDFQLNSVFNKWIKEQGIQEISDHINYEINQETLEKNYITSDNSRKILHIYSSFPEFSEILNKMVDVKSKVAKLTRLQCKVSKKLLRHYDEKNSQNFTENSIQDEIAYLRVSAQNYKHLFNLPNENGKPLYYFCGNSLGAQPKSTMKEVNLIGKQWGSEGIHAWITHWFGLELKAANEMCKLVGALPEEVTLTSTLTENVHKILSTFYRPTDGKNKIIVIDYEFPSDIYAVKSWLKLLNHDEKDCLIEVPLDQYDVAVSNQRIIETIQKYKNQACLFISSMVNYLSCHKYDIKGIAKACHDNDMYCLFNGAHAVGAVDLTLHDDEVDAAVWCNYKYVNSGPGAISGIFIHQKHKSVSPGLQGWHGNKRTTQFQMRNFYEPEDDARRFQISNYDPMQVVKVLKSLEIYNEIGLQNLRKRSQQMVTYLVKKLSDNKNIQILTKFDPECNGGHLAIMIPKCDYQSFKHHIVSKGIIADFRLFNGGYLLRITPSPLYNDFKECDYVVASIKEYFDNIQQSQ